MKKTTKKQLKKMLHQTKMKELRKIVPIECVCERCQKKYGYK
ncbi:hypothetical protein ACS7ZM_002064 [Enterococcus faecalis]